MLGLDWLSSRRRRADSAAVTRRIEPTLAPLDGKVRLRIRFNDYHAAAVTDAEAALHGITVDDAWRDSMGDAPSREVVVTVQIPPFALPAPGHIAADSEPIDDAPPPPEPIPRPIAAAASTPLPTPQARMQPTLSPAEHAARLLSWCRRHGLVGEVIIFDMERAYGRMCEEWGMLPRPWNPVSRELTLLLHGRVGVKHYAISHERDGAHKRRVFRVAAARPDEMRAAA